MSKVSDAQRVSICAVVVTHNRLGTLKQCVNALRNQQRKLKGIVVVDNASTDGTLEWLRSQPDLFVVSQGNVGSAGGFNRGIREAVAAGYDWIWVMDDDTICKPEALAELAKGAEVLAQGARDWGFLCSNVLFSDATPCLMNISYADMRNGWSEFASSGLIKVTKCSFVSLLLPKTVVTKYGLPIKEFFVWGDDSEYTERISRMCECYFVCSSIVEHHMGTNRRADLVNETDERLERHVLHTRNKMRVARANGIPALVKCIVNSLSDIVRICASRKPKRAARIAALVRGIAYGAFFNPPIEYVSSADSSKP